MTRRRTLREKADRVLSAAYWTFVMAAGKIRERGRRRRWEKRRRRLEAARDRMADAVRAQSICLDRHGSVSDEQLHSAESEIDRQAGLLKHREGDIGDARDRAGDERGQAHEPRWRDENADATEASTSHVAEHGPPTRNALRDWMDDLRARDPRMRQVSALYRIHEEALRHEDPDRALDAALEAIRLDKPPRLSKARTQTLEELLDDLRPRHPEFVAAIERRRGRGDRPSDADLAEAWRQLTAEIDAWPEAERAGALAYAREMLAERRRVSAPDDLDQPLEDNEKGGDQPATKRYGRIVQMDDAGRVAIVQDLERRRTHPADLEALGVEGPIEIGDGVAFEVDERGRDVRSLERIERPPDHVRRSDRDLRERIAGLEETRDRAAELQGDMGPILKQQAEARLEKLRGTDARQDDPDQLARLAAWGTLTERTDAGAWVLEADDGRRLAVWAGGGTSGDPPLRTGDRVNFIEVGAKAVVVDPDDPGGAMRRIAAARRTLEDDEEGGK